MHDVLKQISNQKIFNVFSHKTNHLFFVVLILNLKVRFLSSIWTFRLCSIEYLPISDVYQVTYLSDIL